MPSAYNDDEISEVIKTRKAAVAAKRTTTVYAKAVCRLRYVTYSYTKMRPDAISSQTGNGNASVVGDFESSNPTSYSAIHDSIYHRSDARKPFPVWGKLEVQISDARRRLNPSTRDSGRYYLYCDRK